MDEMNMKEERIRMYMKIIKARKNQKNLWEYENGKQWNMGIKKNLNSNEIY